MSGSVLTGRLVRRTRASRVLAVSALAAFSLLVTALPSQSAEGDGTVSAWGSNASGQLGDGTNVAHFTAAPVLNLGPVREIAGGRDFAFALKTDQTVASWGINDGGPARRWNLHQPQPSRCRQRADGHRRDRRGSLPLARGQRRRQRLRLGEEQQRPARGRHDHPQEPASGSGSGNAARRAHAGWRA